MKDENLENFAKLGNKLTFFSLRDPFYEYMERTAIGLFLPSAFKNVYMETIEKEEF